MKKILCIEDAEEYQTLIRRALTGFDVHVCPDLKEARSHIDKPVLNYDLVLLDVSLPDGNGIEFLAEIRARPKLGKTPIFILSYKDDTIHKVAAFAAGVDDYICKPFEPLELRARIEAKLKKSTQSDEEATRSLVGDLMIDRARMRVSLVDKPNDSIPLTPHEFNILFFLSRREDVVYSRQQIIDEVWGNATYITDRAIDAHISRLRRKIKDSKVEIKTVIGMGYKLRH